MSSWADTSSVLVANSADVTIDVFVFQMLYVQTGVLGGDAAGAPAVRRSRHRVPCTHAGESHFYLYLINMVYVYYT